MAAGRRSIWAGVAVLAGGVGLFWATREAFILTHNPRLLPAMVLAGTLVVPAAFVTYLHDPRRERGLATPMVMAVVAAVGGCSALVVAAVLESSARAGGVFGASGQLPAVVVGLVEEGVKLGITMVTLLLFVQRSPHNGLLIGGATGTGFAVLETLGYEFATYLQAGGGLQALDAGLVSRSLFTPATHITWSALAGCAFGYAGTRGWRPWPVVVWLATFCFVVGLHSVWDRDGITAVYAALTVLDLLLLAIVLRAVRRSA